MLKINHHLDGEIESRREWGTISSRSIHSCFPLISSLFSTCYCTAIKSLANI